MPNFPLEAGLTASLWDLFSVEGAPIVAMGALLAQLPAEDPRVQRMVQQPERGVWWPRRSPGADLAIITRDDEHGVAEILAVIEVKAGAQTNWPAKATAAVLPPLDGTTAEEITADYFGGSRSSYDNMSQADLYRSRQWWRSADGISLHDPEAALWLLFDSQGRTVDEAFADASRPSAWISIDLKRFADDLRTAKQAGELTDREQDSVAVVLWHIDQAPPRRRPASPEVPKEAEDERPTVAGVTQKEREEERW
jgi:hypothetical protein